jgi:hypothetical protein
MPVDQKTESEADTGAPDKTVAGLKPSAFRTLPTTV